MDNFKIAYEVSSTQQAQEMFEQVSSKHPASNPNDADVIVAIGGDGFMLSVMHKFVNTNKPIYGINCGTVGFLMNAIAKNDLMQSIKTAISHTIKPLEMHATDTDGIVHRSIAFNEVSLFRTSGQAVHLKISVQKKVRIESLVCDGALLSTPAGSTAYNLSANGPILPIDSNSLALTPISPFTPRRWRGAILPDNAVVTFEVLDYKKRPVLATADHTETKNIIRVVAKTSDTDSAIILTDVNHDLEERIIAEQFS